MGGGAEGFNFPHPVAGVCKHPTDVVSSAKKKNDKKLNNKTFRRAPRAPRTLNIWRFYWLRGFWRLPRCESRHSEQRAVSSTLSLIPHIFIPSKMVPQRFSLIQYSCITIYIYTIKFISANYYFEEVKIHFDLKKRKS